MIPKVIQRQKQLEHLELNGSLSDFAFMNIEISQTTTNIKKLAVEHQSSNQAQKNFRQFIVKNGSTIETLHLTNWPNTSTIYHFWHDLPILKEFHQNCHRVEKVKFDQLNLESMELAEKATLEKLTLLFSNTDPVQTPLELVKPIVSASPNLITMAIKPPVSYAMFEHFRDKELWLYFYKLQSNTEFWTRKSRQNELFKEFLSDDSGGSDQESEDDEFFIPDADADMMSDVEIVDIDSEEEFEESPEVFSTPPEDPTDEDFTLDDESDDEESSSP